MINWSCLSTNMRYGPPLCLVGTVSCSTSLSGKRNLSEETVSLRSRGPLLSLFFDPVGTHFVLRRCFASFFPFLQCLISKNLLPECWTEIDRDRLPRYAIIFIPTRISYVIIFINADAFFVFFYLSDTWLNSRHSIPPLKNVSWNLPAF